ncbi:MAG: hypothetical protein PHC60_05130 [Heliobacteriaceae bacterium]|nr:hypothetical protein [Heliobacteriaceae bacterium]MDD4587749.1 hypothetical protein [Heliobacteriaceae bacterium]
MVTKGDLPARESLLIKKEKGFARGARQEQIEACRENGLAAMQGIAGELGIAGRQAACK